MCGIVGAVAQREVSGILLEGLRRLEVCVTWQEGGAQRNYRLVTLRD